MILYPFLLTRAAFYFTASIAQIISTNQRYVFPEISARGWEIHPLLALDMWARWDTRWYMDIIQNGYSVRGPLGEVQSNIAFYPFYPKLVDFISRPVIGFSSSSAMILAIGILVSSLFLLAALVLLYRLILLDFQDEALAERSILLLLLFPAGFYFSSMYTESTYLFFAVASFYLARLGKWWLAGLSAACLSLTRPLGLLIVIPLAAIYFDSVHWNWRKIRLDLLWLGAAPLALLGYMAALLPVTGDFLAIFKVQLAWDKTFAAPWETIFNPLTVHAHVTSVDRVMLIVFLILSIMALWRLRSISYGLMPLLFLLPVLFTGTLQSATRYCLVLFPAFIVLGQMAKRPAVDRALQLTFYAIQIVFLSMWVRFYFVQ
jgi:hypothetical protein